MIVNISKEVDTTKIRMERARLNISQRQLAEKIKTKRETINAIENKRRKTVKFETLEKIAKIFNLQPEDLLVKEER